jgi:hypothetical protein
MDSISTLSGLIMGFWLAIVGIAILFGVLYAAGASLRHGRPHRNRPDEVGRGP